MSKDNIIKLIQPANVEDQLTEILRNGARSLLAQAVEAEVADFLGKHTDLKTSDGHQRVVRHGHLPEREVMTGIGPVAVRQPRVRDREAAAADPGRIRFSPSILPPYMRRSKSIETLLPILYLKGISTGDFSEALAALLGKDAAGLSASAIGRLKDGWFDEHAAWQKRDLSAKRYVYIWADGIHLEARLEDEKQCILVLIGATPEGRKELVGFIDGARESAQDWRDLLLDLKRRGLDVPPRLVIADGALGFWKAAGEVWPKTREQRCWVHKTANVLAKLPKSQQPKAKRALQEIWMAETRAVAELAFRLPTSVKLRDGRGKWVVKQVARRYLPAEIVDRRKVGFRVPLDRWFRDDLSAMAHDLLLDPGSFVASALDNTAVRQLVGRHISGRSDESARLWNLLSLEVWHEAWTRSTSTAVGLTA